MKAVLLGAVAAIALSALSAPAAQAAAPRLDAAAVTRPDGRAEIVLDLSAPVDAIARLSADGKRVSVMLVARSRDLAAVSAALGDGLTLRRLDGATLLLELALDRPAALRGARMEETAGGGSRLVIETSQAAAAPGRRLVALPFATLPERAQLAAASIGASAHTASTGQRQLAQAQPNPADIAERDRLFDEMLRRPADLATTLRYADVSLKVGDPEGAVIAYERLLLLDPSLTRIRLELGATYALMGSGGMAKVYLQEVAERADASPDQKAKANELMAAIDKASVPRGLFASVFGGVRFQTNATAGPDGNSIRAQGFRVPPSGDAKKRSDFNVFLGGNARYVADAGFADWDSDLSLYGSRQSRVDENDTALTELRTGLRFNNAFGFRGLSLRPHVIGGLTLLEDKLYQGQYGVGLDIDQEVSESFTLGATIDYRYRHYHDVGKRTTVSETSADEVGLRLRGRYLVTPTQALTGELGVRHDDARLQYNNFTEYGGTLGYSVTYQAPLALTEQPWTVSLSGGIYYTTYGGADPAVDPAVKRRDRELRGSVSNYVPFAERWGMFLQMQASDVDSTLENYTYKNLSTTLGLSHSF